MKLNHEYKKKNILCISDMHIPYHHQDAFKFLSALKKKYNPDLVVSLGDLVDWHSISFHPKDPDLAAAGGELKLIRKHAAILETLFPSMIIIGSNHGDLPLRKFKDAGLPKELLRNYNDIYGVGKSWKFVDDLTLIDGQDAVYFTHGISKNGLKLATQRGINVVQGHYHSEFRVDYASNPRNLLWNLQVGCLIDKDALAFSYDKLNLQRPIIGTGGIFKGFPTLLPMILNSNGRWTK